MWPIIRFNEHPPLSLSYFLSFPSIPQLQRHRIANWICISISGTIILKVQLRGGREKFLTTTMPVVVDWGGGVFAE